MDNHFMIIKIELISSNPNDKTDNFFDFDIGAQ